MLHNLPFNMSEMNDKEKKYIEAIGKNIVLAREAKGFTQVELANSINMEDSSLRRIEKGRVNSTILMLKRIAEGLDVSINSLLP